MSRTALLLQGLPGCGKSAASEEYAARKKLKFICRVSSQEDPVDICGIAGVKDGKTIRYTPDWWVDACENPCLILMDEITSGTAEQLAAALRATDDSRTLNEHKLHKDTLVIAAMNPPEFAAGSARELPAPILNRFRIRKIDSGPGVEWLTGGHGIKLELPEKPPVAGMRAMVGTYLSAKRDAAEASEETIRKAVEEQGPFPSLRAWCRAADEEGDMAFWPEFVGKEAALAFMSWLKAQDLPDPLEIYAGRCLTVPARGDACMTTANTLAQILCEKPATDEAMGCVLNWYRLASEANQTANCMPAVRRIAGKMDVSRHVDALKAYLDVITTIIKG